VGDVRSAGSIEVFYGSPEGLDRQGGQIWNQDMLNGDGAERWDNFGSALAVGDFNGDDYDDLAVGVARETLGSGRDFTWAGAVNVIYGSPEGLHCGAERIEDVYVPENQFIHLPIRYYDDRYAGEDDKFGFSLAAIEYKPPREGTRHFVAIPPVTGLMVGIPYEDIGGGVESRRRSGEKDAGATGTASDMPVDPPQKRTSR